MSLNFDAEDLSRMDLQGREVVRATTTPIDVQVRSLRLLSQTNERFLEIIVGRSFRSAVLRPTPRHLGGVLGQKPPKDLVEEGVKRPDDVLPSLPGRQRERIQELHLPGLLSRL